MKLSILFQLPDSLDPDDRRRRQILNIILSVFLAGGLFSVIATFSYGDSLLAVVRDPNGILIFLSSLSLIVLVIALFFLNRVDRLGSLAGWLFVLALTGIIFISDKPDQLLSTDLIFWTLPILAGGIVLPPLAVYAVASFIAVVNVYISIAVLHVAPNPYSLGIFFVLGALTWLGMSIANNAIRTARMEAQKNAAILNGVADGVVVLNEEDQVVLANPVALSLMGTGIAAIAAQQRSQQELRGRILAFEWSDVSGVGKVAIVRDISRQVEIDRAKDAILGVVSHEMRTPLAAILGFAEVLALRSDSVAETANRIHANAERLIHMVDDLLQHAQAQAGALKIRDDVVYLASLMQTVTDATSGLAGQKNLLLRTDMDPDLPEKIRGDGARLQQILVNLVGNAIKFTEQGEVCVSFQKRDSEWSIIVRDTGIGIPPERLPDIFEPFRRASDYATRSHQGAGLGLSIVKTLVNLMHGNIEVESSIGCWTVFTVTLPLKEEIEI